MASSFPFGSPAPERPAPQERLKAVEDQVRGDFEAREELYRLVAYKFLNALGLRITTVEADIRRQLGSVAS